MSVIWMWLAAMVYVEAVSEILVNGEIFAKLRGKLNTGFFGALISCGYCISVWISATVFWMLPPIFPTDHTAFIVFDGVVKLFVLHRLSNFFHELLSRWFNRVPIQLVLTKFENQTPSQEEKTINVS